MYASVAAPGQLHAMPIGSAECVGKLIQDLSSPDGDVVKASLNTLGQIGRTIGSEILQEKVPVGGCSKLVQLSKIYLETARMGIPNFDEVTELKGASMLLHVLFSIVAALTLKHSLSKCIISSIGPLKVLAKVLKTFPKCRRPGMDCTVQTWPVEDFLVGETVQGTNRGVETGTVTKIGIRQRRSDQVRGVRRRVTTFAIGANAQVQTQCRIQRGVVVDLHAAKVSGTIQRGILGHDAVKVHVAVNNGHEFREFGHGQENILDRKPALRRMKRRMKQTSWLCGSQSLYQGGDDSSEG
jgi:hypothetical protein